MIDATLGRMGNQPGWYAAAFARQLAKMHHVLADCSGADCDHAKPDFRTVQVKDGVAEPRSARLEDPVALAADFAENLLLEYAEGLPMEQVGWSRVSRADLDDLMELNTRYHDFMLRTPYAAQVAGSDLAAHIRDTLLGMASEQAVPGRLGQPQDHFVWLDGHDVNLTWLGGLLRLDWLLPDQTFNATPPGSALVFELHRSRARGLQMVQVFFISQTLEQMRDLKALHDGEQPSVAPICIPGCSGPAPAFACTVAEFANVIAASADSRFVEAPQRAKTQ